MMTSLEKGQASDGKAEGEISALLKSKLRLKEFDEAIDEEMEINKIELPYGDVGKTVRRKFNFDLVGHVRKRGRVDVDVVDEEDLNHLVSYGLKFDDGWNRDSDLDPEEYNATTTILVPVGDGRSSLLKKMPFIR